MLVDALGPGPPLWPATGGTVDARARPAGCAPTPLAAARAPLPVNTVLGTNYGFVSAPPGQASALDLLGPWPWYLVSVACLLAVVFALMTWPWTTERARAGTPRTHRVDTTSRTAGDRALRAAWASRRSTGVDARSRVASGRRSSESGESAGNHWTGVHVAFTPRGPLCTRVAEAALGSTERRAAPSRHRPCMHPTAWGRLPLAPRSVTCSAPPTTVFPFSPRPKPDVVRWCCP